MFSFIYSLFWSLLSYFALISLATYLIPYLITTFLLNEQDLKKKYNSKWALVTGASSGIGLAITHKLAKQGINVVMAALDDDVLKQSFADVKKLYPKVEFRLCGVNLGKKGFMENLIESTKDIPINLLFNNAGFITTGLFAQTPIGRLTANFECNAGCQVEITHYFLNKMIEQKLSGAICFTSSPAFLIANPISSLYGSTKAFVTEFAASLAGEVREHGIDVIVMHPSPTTTAFYANAHEMDSLGMFKRTGVTPDVIASAFFRGVGRVVIFDQGWFPLVFKIFVKLIDPNLMADIVRFVCPYMADYKLVQKKKDE